MSQQINIRTMWFLYAAIAIALAFPSTAVAQTAGPDVIVGAVDNLQEDGRTASGFIGLTASTDSCNVGDVGISWWKLPRADHVLH